MIQSTVTSMPIHSTTVSRPIAVIAAYSNTITSTPTDKLTRRACRRPHAAPEVAHVLREADVAGGDLERPAEDELPDEEEWQQMLPRRVLRKASRR